MPIKIEEFYSCLVDRGYDFFAGVPDSLLKSFCAYAKEHAPEGKFLITANEGNAVGIAAGYHIATGRYGVVYMQNSGLGNAVNPLLSLADKEVYSIPMLLVVGWRGEPGVKDEPQHVKQGAITNGLLETMGIDYAVLDGNNYESQIEQARIKMERTNCPFALVVRKGMFSDYAIRIDDAGYELKREDAIARILDSINDKDFVVSTTGKTSRELFEIRESRHQGHARDFLTVGSMGHASSIALGMSYGTDHAVWCIDGDGAFLMHMGALPAVTKSLPQNFKYIINVNGAHESVGGQPTAGFDLDIPGILLASGFRIVEEAETSSEIAGAMEVLANALVPAALVLYTKQGSRSDLGRPSVGPQENKRVMMEQFRSDVNAGCENL